MADKRSTAAAGVNTEQTPGERTASSPVEAVYD